MVAFEFKSTTIFIWNLNVKYLGLNFFFFFVFVSKLCGNQIFKA